MRKHRFQRNAKLPMLVALALSGAALACSTPVASTTVPTGAAPAATAPQPSSEAPTAAPSSRHAIIQSSDFSLASFGMDGQSTPFGKANFRLSPGPYFEPSVAGGKLYAVSQGDQTSKSAAYAIDASGAQSVAAIADTPLGLAVWPGSGAGPGRIAWGESDLQQSPIASKLMIADTGAASGVAAYQVTSDQQLYVVPFRWTPDGTRLYFSMEPMGLGGYILFSGHSSLYSLDTASGQPVELIPPDVEHSIICLDDLSPDFTMISGHCDKQIGVTNLQTKQKTVINPPQEIPANSIGQQGDVRFSPDGTRLAFAIARADSTNEQGWVVVTDDLSGSSRLVATSPVGTFYSVLGWLDDSHVLLAAHSLTDVTWDSIQVLALDGAPPREIAADSIFVAFAP